MRSVSHCTWWTTMHLLMDRKMNDVLRCPSCEQLDHIPVFTSWNGYPILRCAGCRLVFTDDRKAPPPEALYPNFEQSDSRTHSQVRSALALFLRQRAAF